jgi:hypothetical protein
VGYRGLARESVVAPMRRNEVRAFEVMRSSPVADLFWWREAAGTDRAIDRMPMRLIVRRGESFGLM